MAVDVDALRAEVVRLLTGTATPDKFSPYAKAVLERFDVLSERLADTTTALAEMLWVEDNWTSAEGHTRYYAAIDAARAALAAVAPAPPTDPRFVVFDAPDGERAIRYVPPVAPLPAAPKETTDG